MVKRNLLLPGKLNCFKMFSERFRHNIVIRKGVFHIICLLLGIIGKRFQGAGFRILCIGVPGNCGKFCFQVMEGLRYNRAVRMHKLVYEALMRQARSGFRILCIGVPGNCGKFCFQVMEGLRYNRAVRMHKLVYEALMRQARSGFSTWVT